MKTEPARQRCIEPDCGTAFDLNAHIYVCSRCGGLLDVESKAIEDANALKQRWRQRRISLDERDRSGVWRFRELLPFPDDARIVSLGEGNTPLYDAPKSARYCGLEILQLKHQGANPTGSFKDTGMTAAITQARRLGAKLVVCASTGNTAASLAAYAAKAGFSSAIIVPQGQVSHAKLAQALDYGALVIEVNGNFDTSMRLIQEIAEDNSIYLVNSINPFRIEGQKTVAAELCEQLNWTPPEHLVLPGGNLGNSSALGKGFHELVQLGFIQRLPQITVVQAEGAAPFADLFSQHRADLEKGVTPPDLPSEKEPKTLASAIKIGAPVSWKKAWRSLAWSGGRVLTVSEQEIADAKAIIGRDGIGCEPASATTVAGIKKLVANGIINNNQSVVAVLTGHVLKDTDYVIKYHRGELITEGRQIAGEFSNRPVQVNADAKQIRNVLARLIESGAGD